MDYRRLFDGSRDHPRSKYYDAGGAVCCVTTNSELVFAAASSSFAPIAAVGPSADLIMDLWVDGTAPNASVWPQPYFRAQSHLVFGAFDSQDTFLVDLRRRRIIGRFSPALAADWDYWRRVIFPVLFGIVSGSLGITPLHCACVERNGRGLVLAGDSGSGKSTLSLALAQSGFTFLSDDWTYFSRRGGRLLAWGLGTPLKLVPSALEHFPELARLKPGISLNGELAYEVQPEQVFRIRRCQRVEPHWLMVLERCEYATFALSEISPVDAATRLEADLERLPANVSGARDFLVKTIRLLVQRPCWMLRYGGKPRVVAQAVLQWLEANSGMSRDSRA